MYTTTQREPVIVKLSSKSRGGTAGFPPVNPDFRYSRKLGVGAKIVKFELFSEFEARTSKYVGSTGCTTIVVGDEWDNFGEGKF